MIVLGVVALVASAGYVDGAEVGVGEVEEVGEGGADGGEDEGEVCGGWLVGWGFFFFFLVRVERYLLGR